MMAFGGMMDRPVPFISTASPPAESESVCSLLEYDRPEQLASPSFPETDSSCDKGTCVVLNRPSTRSRLHFLPPPSPGSPITPPPGAPTPGLPITPPPGSPMTPPPGTCMITPPGVATIIPPGVPLTPPPSSQQPSYAGQPSMEELYYMQRHDEEEFKNAAIKYGCAEDIFSFHRCLTDRKETVCNMKRNMRRWGFSNLFRYLSFITLQCHEPSFLQQQH